MSRLLFIAAVGILPLAFAVPAEAHGPSHSHGGSYSPAHHSGPSCYSHYGTRFSHGYYFGRNNFHWNRRYWSSRYGCYYYWNPYASGWYYWYAPGNGYYPASYISSAPPPAGVPDAAAGAVPPVPGM